MPPESRESTQRFPQSGRRTRPKALGPPFPWLALILKVAFALIGMGAYISLFFPDFEIVPVALVIAILLAALGLAVSVVSAPAQASSESPVLSRILASGTLRVGMSGGQPPLNFKSKSGALLGLEVDLANLLAGAMRVELEIVNRPFGELLGAMGEGAVDMVMSVPA